MSSFILKIFNLKEKKFIILKDKWSYFSNKECTNYLAVTAQKLIEWVNYIIDNSYIHFQGKIYRQVIDIPMGTSCAPYLDEIRTSKLRHISPECFVIKMTVLFLMMKMISTITLY